MATTRRAAVAGSWYPGTATALAGEVDPTEAEAARDRKDIANNQLKTVDIPFDEKHVIGYGIEKDPERVLACLKSGVNVIQVNLERGLAAEYAWLTGIL